MPTVAQLAGRIRIEQYYGDHHPPHFHATQGDEEALIEIAMPMNVYKGALQPGVLRDVRDWAVPRQAALALNWVEALANGSVLRIP